MRRYTTCDTVHATEGKTGLVNYKVNLTKRVNVAGKNEKPQFRFCPVVEADNGRIKPDWVRVGAGSEDGGKDERHPEGKYYIEWREGGTRFRRSAGKDAQAAQAKRLAKRAELIARSHGVAVGPSREESEKNGRVRIADAIAAYLLTKGVEKPRTRVRYRIGLNYFLESCDKQYLDEITREDVLGFMSYLRSDKKQALRTARDTATNIVSFLKAQNIRVMQPRDIPKVIHKDVSIYEAHELAEIFAACTPNESLWFNFFLKTGFRKEEVIYCTWKDVNFHAKTIAVRPKPKYHWTPKTHECREVPVPDDLIEALSKYKQATNPECPLVFPTSGCKPKFDFLLVLKRVARRTKLDPKECILHRFRATFATRHLWNGVDLATVQRWMGHKDLASTMRYLRDQRGPAIREKVNSTFA